MKITISDLKSEIIKEFSYAVEKSTLLITFSKGGVYSYADVPVALFYRFIAAESHGKFFHAEIRKSYVGVKQ